MEIKEECVCSLPQLEATEEKKNLLSVGLLSWIVFYHSSTLPLLAFSQGKSMRIRTHFPNLRCADQDVSASSQQLYELCFLVRLARKQQFISWGTLGLKTRPSKCKERILSTTKPRGTTRHQIPGRDVTTSLCRAGWGDSLAVRMPWAMGKCPPLQMALLLTCCSSPPLSSLHWEKPPVFFLFLFFFPFFSYGSPRGLGQEQSGLVVLWGMQTIVTIAI